MTNMLNDRNSRSRNHFISGDHDPAPPLEYFPTLSFIWGSLSEIDYHQLVDEFKGKKKREMAL